MIDRNRAGMRAVSRRLSAVALVVALGACQDLPLHPGAGRALPPDAPALLLNPLCSGTGGTTHASQTIVTAVTWQASGNPHRVTGDVSVSTGGQLTLQPGVVACFTQYAGLQATGGGRLVAQGLAASRIVLTASDLALGWKGVVLNGDPSSASLLKNATIEHTALGTAGIDAFYHLVVIDSTVIRQTGQGVRLWGRGSRMVRSQVDTTLDRAAPAVFLSDSVYLEQTVVRGAAGVGVETDLVARVHLLGVRIEGPAGTGLRISVPNSIKSAQPVRVVGGGTYGAELTVDAMARVYPDLTDQDSLLGNARDTLLMLGGSLNDDVYARAVLPWHVKGSIHVGAGGVLRGQAGALLVFDPNTGISTRSGGRVRIRGWRPAPVVLTADYPAAGWDGILLEGTPGSESYLTNVRVEHVRVDSTAVIARSGHPVVIDSAVFRRNGRAVALWSANSRLSRSRVDTTLAADSSAVLLASNALLESTRIRASSGQGLSIHSSAVQVTSCEVRNSQDEGIVLWEAVAVHNCNLVSNHRAGIRNRDTSVTANTENNWWGDPAGPNVPGADVAWGAQDYTPWLTAPVVLPYVP